MASEQQDPPAVAVGESAQVQQVHTTHIGYGLHSEHDPFALDGQVPELRVVPPDTPEERLIAIIASDALALTSGHMFTDRQNLIANRIGAYAQRLARVHGLKAQRAAAEAAEQKAEKPNRKAPKKKAANKKGKGN